MKKRMKMLALLLATAVATTSVPYQNVVLAATTKTQETSDFSAYEAAIKQFAIGEEAVTPDAPSALKGIYWSDGDEQDSEEYAYSDDLRTKRRDKVFTGNSVLKSDNWLSVDDAELSCDETSLLKQLEYDSEKVSIINMRGIVSAGMVQ